MNKKRFIIASIVLFVAFEILEFIIHSVLLGAQYQKLAHLWRPDMQSMMWIFAILYLIFSFVFTYIFTKGYEAKGIMEGVRFGLIIGLVMNMFGAFSSYAIYPIPFDLCLQWFVYGMIEYVILGVVVAAIYKK